jgi:hypothetical protein
MTVKYGKIQILGAKIMVFHGKRIQILAEPLAQQPWAVGPRYQ